MQLSASTSRASTRSEASSAANSAKYGLPLCPSKTCSASLLPSLAIFRLVSEKPASSTAFKIFPALRYASGVMSTSALR